MLEESINCIYCLQDRDGSIEHIFPDSLGGLFKFKEVCKKCNEYLGQEVDSPLINNIFMQLKRMELKIPGKKGKIPNLFSNGELDDGSKIQYKWMTKEILKVFILYLKK